MRRVSLLLAVLLLLPLVPIMTHASTIPVLSPSTITISNDGYYTVKLYGQSLTYWNSSSSVLDSYGSNYNEPYPSYFSTPNGIEMVDVTNFVCSGGSWWATTVTYPVSYLFGNCNDWYVNSTWIVEGSSGSGAQLFITWGWVKLELTATQGSGYLEFLNGSTVVGKWATSLNSQTLLTLNLGLHLVPTSSPGYVNVYVYFQGTTYVLNNVYIGSQSGYVGPASNTVSLEAYDPSSSSYSSVYLTQFVDNQYVYSNVVFQVPDYYNNTLILYQGASTYWNVSVTYYKYQVPAKGLLYLTGSNNGQTIVTGPFTLNTGKFQAINVTQNIGQNPTLQLAMNYTNMYMKPSGYIVVNSADIYGDFVLAGPVFLMVPFTTTLQAPKSVIAGYLNVTLTVGQSVPSWAGKILKNAYYFGIEVYQDSVIYTNVTQSSPGTYVYHVKLNGTAGQLSVYSVYEYLGGMGVTGLVIVQEGVKSQEVNLISSSPQGIYPGKSVTLNVTQIGTVTVNWGNGTVQSISSGYISSSLTLELKAGTTVFLTSTYQLNATSTNLLTFTVPSVTPGIYTISLTTPYSSLTIQVAVSGLSTSMRVLIVSPVNDSSATGSVKMVVKALQYETLTYTNGTQVLVSTTPLSSQTVVVTAGYSLSGATQQGNAVTNSSGYASLVIPLPNNVGKYYVIASLYGYSVYNFTLVNVTSPQQTVLNSSTVNQNYTKPFNTSIPPNSTLYSFPQPWAFVVGAVVVTIITLLAWKFMGKPGIGMGSMAGVIVASYLGLMPWYVFYIMIFAVAMLFAKVLVDRFMGEE